MEELRNFLEYLQDKVADCYKEETSIAIERFLKDFERKCRKEISENV